VPEVDTPVLLALQGPGETELVAAINATPGITVTRRCGDVAELLGAAGARVGAIAVVLETQGGRWPSALIIAAFIALTYLIPPWGRAWERHLAQQANHFTSGHNFGDNDARRR